MRAMRRVITVEDERLAVRCAKGHVALIDDDVHIVQSLQELIEYEGYACSAFVSVEEFLWHENEPVFPGPRCILSDMCIPGLDGLALQEHLPAQSDRPLVFMSGNSSVRQTAQAFRNGALHFLTKPVDDNELFSVLEEALARSAQLQEQVRWTSLQASRIATLTLRELELARMLPEGQAIKVMADRMCVTDRAIKLYKKSLMNKLQIESVYELVRLQDYGLL